MTTSAQLMSEECSLGVSGGARGGVGGGPRGSCGGRPAGPWNRHGDGRDGEGGGERMVRKMDLYCSKVSIPDKTINVGLYRHYGEPYPFPQSIQYGTLTTTFYCDATMTIKRFFDAWQKLIINDMTGNFNYYDEYISSFDIFPKSP